MNDDVTFAPATGYSLIVLADLLERSFEGYLIPFVVTPVALATRCRVEHVDLAASCVVSKADEPIGLALVTRRGDRARIGLMGFVTRCRGMGLGRATLTRSMSESSARADRSLDLEVFASNAPAVALYRKLGFVTRRDLIGWESAPLAGRDGGAAEAIEERAPSAFGEQLARHEGVDVPWQLEAATLASASAPARTFSLANESFVFVSAIDERALTLRGIFTHPAARRRGLARRLLEALSARFPGRALHFPPLVPADAAPGFFRALGFSLSPLAQYDMRWTP